MDRADLNESSELAQFHGHSTGYATKGNSVKVFFAPGLGTRCGTRSARGVGLGRARGLFEAGEERDPWSGDFAADPAPTKCWRCDYAPLCPAKAR